jgi:hypothetical protein
MSYDTNAAFALVTSAPMLSASACVKACQALCVLTSNQLINAYRLEGHDVPRHPGLSSTTLSDSQ